MEMHFCKTHPSTEAIHFNNTTNEPLCVSCAIARRQGGASPTDVLKFSSIKVPVPAGTHPARLCFQVQAGLIPGKSLPEYTEEWWITSEQWERMMNNPELTPDHPDNLFTRFQAEAYWYAERITDPRTVNWVRVEFIYF